MNKIPIIVSSLLILSLSARMHGRDLRGEILDRLKLSEGVYLCRVSDVDPGQPWCPCQIRETLCGKKKKKGNSFFALNVGLQLDDLVVVVVYSKNAEEVYRVIDASYIPWILKEENGKTKTVNIDLQSIRNLRQEVMTR